MSLKRSGAVRQGHVNYGSIPHNQNETHPSTAGPPISNLSPASHRPDNRGSERLAEVRHQVDEVKGIMKDNIEKVIERDGKVQHLGERADVLRSETHGFKEKAKTIRRTAQWKSWKMTCCIIVVVLVILALITLAILFGLKIIK